MFFSSYFIKHDEVKYKFSLIKMFYDIIWQATSLKRYDLHG